MICRNHPDVSEDIRFCVRCGTSYCPDCLVEINGIPYCAGCKTEQLMDLRSGVNRTSLNLAGVLQRWGALIIDGIITNAPAYVIMIAVMAGLMASKREPGLWFNFIGLPFIFVKIIYEALMMKHKNGQTLGKIALRVRVVRADGGPLSNGQAWGRAAMKLILSSCLYITYIPALFTEQKTTLHDMVAGTRVVEA